MVLTWLTNTTVSYPTNMMPLICDCRSFMNQDWVVQVQHIYRETNACVDDSTKRRTRQQNHLSGYNSCPSFAYMYYVRDLAGLEITRLCAQGPVVGAV